LLGAYDAAFHAALLANGGVWKSFAKNFQAFAGQAHYLGAIHPLTYRVTESSMKPYCRRAYIQGFPLP
jgi:hypothetical protein